MNQVVTFEQRVKARVSEVAAELIPADDLDLLVRAQVAHFQHEELPKMIKDAIRAEYAKVLLAEFSKPEYAPTWNTAGGQMLGEAVQKIITENAGQMMASLVGSMVQQTMYAMQSTATRF
jgi:hypothetical protein